MAIRGKVEGKTKDETWKNYQPELSKIKEMGFDPEPSSEPEAFKKMVLDPEGNKYILQYVGHK